MQFPALTRGHGTNTVNGIVTMAQWPAPVYAEWAPVCRYHSNFGVHRCMRVWSAVMDHILCSRNECGKLNANHFWVIGSRFSVGKPNLCHWKFHASLNTPVHISLTRVQATDTKPLISFILRSYQIFFRQKWLTWMLTVLRRTVAPQGKWENRGCWHVLDEGSSNIWASRQLRPVLNSWDQGESESVEFL